MQKVATRVFVCASIVFGVLGILMVLTGSFDNGSQPSDLSRLFQKLLMLTVFVILPSFALSVASKYLNGKS